MYQAQRRIRNLKAHDPANSPRTRRSPNQLQVHLLRLDADTGHFFVSERVPAGRQLPLPI